MAAKGTKMKTVANKRKPVQKLKNVLAYPFPQYWPALNEQQMDEFKSFMISQKERFGEKFNPSENCPMIGLSKMLREINRNTVVYFILSTEIKPRFVANQIINLTLSRHRTSKVLCAPNLKELTRNLFGIESLAFGYKAGEYSEIEKWISEKQQDWFPIPVEISNYFCPTMKSAESSIIKPNPKAIEKTKIDFSRLYLRRDAIDQRAFVPANTKSPKPFSFDDFEPKPAEWSDYISFSGKTHSNAEEMNVDDDDDDDDSRLEYNKQKLVNQIKQLISSANCESSKASEGEIQTTKILGEISPENGANRKRKGNKKIKEKHKTMPFSYINLKVNRIQPNPDKQKKKKKK